MNGATAICESTPDTWADNAISDESSPEEWNARENPPPNFVEKVFVTFEDVDKASPDEVIERRVYRVIPQQPGFDGPSYVRRFQIESPHFSCAADVNTTVSSPWLVQGTSPDVDPNTWRGVFAIQHQHRELFSQNVELNLGTLPRWKPQITITRRMLDTDDE
ncbi:MAG: hypothetical protein ABIG44_15020 [Planctomycetota bacterium]